MGLFIYSLADSSGSRPFDMAVDMASASACRWLVLGVFGVAFDAAVTSSTSLWSCSRFRLVVGFRCVMVATGHWTRSIYVCLGGLMLAWSFRSQVNSLRSSMHGGRKDQMRHWLRGLYPRRVTQHGLLSPFYWSLTGLLFVAGGISLEGLIWSTLGCATFR